MQKSSYVEAVPAIVADMERQRQEDDERKQEAPDELEGTIEGGAQPTLFRYTTESGGVVLSNVPLEEDAPPPVVDSQEPETDQRPTSRQHRKPPLFLHFLLLLLIFVALDNVDTVFASLAPTVTVTITPQVKTISTTGSLTIGQSGAQVQGRVLPALTLSQQQTVATTGRGYQKAEQATGTLTFYNGLSTVQTVLAGTVFTGRDSVEVATDYTVSIPAATPGNPPQFGSASVTAHAVYSGTMGNIAPGDITYAGSSLQVANGQFQHGRNERHYSTVAKSDIDQPAATLKAQVTQSMQAALQGQLRNGQELLTLPCQPVTSTSHNLGDEAASVTISVSETCSGLAYDQQQLQTAATKILTTQATKQLGKGYQLNGQVQVREIAATPTKKTVVIHLSLSGTWVYQINEQQVKSLVVSKPRFVAIHLLEETPGVQTVSIVGVSDNTQLPTDTAHIHLVIFAEV